MLEFVGALIEELIALSPLLAVIIAALGVTTALVIAVCNGSETRRIAQKEHERWEADRADSLENQRIEARVIFIAIRPAIGQLGAYAVRLRQELATTDDLREKVAVMTSAHPLMRMRIPDALERAFDRFHRLPNEVLVPLTNAYSLASGWVGVVDSIRTSLEHKDAKDLELDAQVIIGLEKMLVEIEKQLDLCEENAIKVGVSDSNLL